jgi:ATP-dependent Lon protease
MNSENDFENQVNKCTEFLKDKSRTKQISNRVTNVDVKQTIERSQKTYISKDAVTEAVKRLGIPFRQIPENPSVIYIGITKRSLGQ